MSSNRLNVHHPVSSPPGVNSPLAQIICTLYRILFSLSLHFFNSLIHWRTDEIPLRTVKRGILLYLFAVVLVGKLNAQSVWSWLSPKPQGNVLVAVQAVDTNIVVAAGAASTIIRTIDGGNYWTVQQRVGGTADYLNDIVISETGTGIAVGQNGKVLVTTDTGETWSTQSAGTTSFLWAVEYTGEHTWIVTSSEGRFHRSTDDGITWNTIIPNGSYTFINLYFVTSMTGFAVGTSGSVVRSTDGGLTWEDKSVSTTLNLRGAHFFTADTGFVWGDLGVFFETSDGGETWSSRSNVPILSEVTFVDRQVGYATGELSSNALYKTTDGGDIWLFTGEGNVAALSFANVNVGFGVGTAGTILKTGDAGGTWLSQSTVVPCSFFRDIGFADEATGVIVGWEGKIYRTTDRGEEWDSRWTGDDASFNSVSLEDSTGFVVGNGGRILRSVDEGQSWNYQNSGTAINLNDIGFWDNVTIAVGDSGYVLRSEDLGQTWAMISSGTTWGLQSIGFFSEDTIVIVGGEPSGGAGEILRSTDKGFTWKTVLGVTPYIINRIAIRGATAIATSLRGDIYVSTDCGASWIVRWLGIQDDIYGVALNTEQKGVVVTAAGGVLTTSNGGVTWTDESSVTSNWLFGACYVNPDTIIMVGWGATVLQLSSSTPTNADNSPASIATQYMLHQNYPNPFNPSTTINFSLPQLSDVSLKIFTLLGEEVATLVSGEMEAGTHSAQWDATGNPSGVYFYQLQAGDFTETKRLILLR